MTKCKAMNSATLLTKQRHPSLAVAHPVKGPEKKIDDIKSWGKRQRDGRKEEESATE